MRISGADIDENPSQRFRKVIIVIIIIYCYIILTINVLDVVCFCCLCCFLFYGMKISIFIN